jgi:hypothetical protein
MGSSNEARMTFEQIRASRDVGHGKARIGPDKDRRCSNGHGWSTSHNCPHHRERHSPRTEHGQSSGSQSWYRHLPLAVLTVPTDGPHKVPTTSHSVGTLSQLRGNFGPSIPAVQRIGKSCKWALGLGPARRGVYFAEHVTPKEKLGGVFVRKRSSEMLRNRAPAAIMIRNVPKRERDRSEKCRNDPINRRRTYAPAATQGVQPGSG